MREEISIGIVVREALSGCSVKRPEGARQDVGTIWVTISVIQMRDDEGLDQGGGGGDRGGQAQEQVKSVGIKDLQGNDIESHLILLFSL